MPPFKTQPPPLTLLALLKQKEKKNRPNPCYISTLVGFFITKHAIVMLNSMSVVVV
jgi:hypothetical protein